MDVISRAAAIEALGERPYNWTDSDSEIAEVCAWESHKSAIENAPAVDAVPVVHARWIQADLDEDYVTCSRCKENGSKDRMAWTPEFAEILKYCPTCGAKMDREDA